MIAWALTLMVAALALQRRLKSSLARRSIGSIAPGPPDLGRLGPICPARFTWRRSMPAKGREMEPRTTVPTARSPGACFRADRA